MTYSFLDHPGEVELLLEAGSEQGIYSDALLALAELVDSGAAAGRQGERRIELAAGDRASLLVDWLNELVYLADVDGFVPGRIERLSLQEAALEATVGGRLDAEPSSLVKAATLTGAVFAQHGPRWRARVVLDV